MLGLITVGVTLVTPPPPPASLHRLTYWSRHSVEVRAELPGDEDNMVVPDTANTTKREIADTHVLTEITPILM